MSRFIKKAFCLAIVLLLLLTITVPVFAASGKESEKRIKVGYMNHPGFIEKDDEGGYSGYGVEYIEDICKYTGWQIEYVYAPWAEQLDMLERGELDIVPMAQYSEERAKRFTFTDQPIGIIQCLLLTLPKGENDIENNAEACDGKTIGILRGSKNIELLKKYAEHMGFDYKQVEYDFQSELEDALVAGDIDIIACEQTIASKSFRLIDRFASDQYYFITAKDNSLIEELDYVISKINAYDPAYSSKLHRKYFGNGLVSESPYFTKEETDFISTCGVITVALLPDNRPDVYTNELGEIDGTIPGIMEKISELSGLKFSYVYIPKNKTPLETLKANPEYIASGMLASNPAFADEDVLLTDVYYSAYSSLFATRANLNKPDISTGKYKVGTTASFQTMHLFVKKNYPNMTISDYLTIEDALMALERGEIDYVAYSANTVIPLLANPRYGDVSVDVSCFMENPQCAVCLKNETNLRLMDIINKCISVIPEETILRMESEHVQNSLYHFDQNDVIQRYQKPILSIALVIVGVLALLATLLLLRQYQYTRDITLHAEYDMMTGLYNRETMKGKVLRTLEENKGKEYAFLIIDVDDLKRINDALGDTAGDEVIKTLANTLKSQFRGSELVGRVGGDEFAVFISAFESKSILVPALTRLQQAILRVNVANGKATLKVSIGVMIGMAGREDADEMYRRADEALRRMKANGKNGFTFYESQNSISMSTELQSEGEESSDEAVSQPVQSDIQQSVPENPALLPSVGDTNYRDMIESFPNIGLYVIEKSTHKVLYTNKRFKGICPNMKLGVSCRNTMFGPCQNCIVDTMGEHSVAHTIYYSDLYGDEVEITATKIMWEGSVPAVMISSWPRNLLTSSSDRLPGASNHDSFDYLTGGLTRAGFIHMMERMQKGGVDLTEYALLFINLKDFKAVNEMVGSNGGDNLLRFVFMRVEQSKLRPVIGARKESDHFIFMVEKNSLDLSELPELLNFHWQFFDKNLFIHCRCGVYNIEDSSVEIYKMIDRAKLAKEHIVDDYIQPYAVYDRSMMEEYSERATAFLMFDNGIKNKEFVVYYQPVVDAMTERVVGAEALVRRKTADGKIVSPGKFIPILERTGYISMLDRFVAESVSRFQTDRISNRLPTVPVSVNLSQKDFYDSKLMELLVTNLENSTLLKGSILLEVTESAYTLHEKNHKELLKRLRDAGAKILLDDFGTGYSSFGMFNNYNFDRVKLDMSFVRQLADNPNVRTVVSSIISMCHNLGVQVVAEGVESEEELSILRDMNCDLIQGYYFSKPISEADFIEYIETHI